MTKKIAKKNQNWFNSYLEALVFWGVVVYVGVSLGVFIWCATGRMTF